MKTYFPLLLLLMFVTACGSQKSIFKLEGQQSMLMTGKGTGQDAAINPYSNQNSTAVVCNLGDTVFSVRIQQEGTILQETPILPGATKEFKLEPGVELYLDSEQGGRAKVTFKKRD